MEYRKDIQGLRAIAVLLVFIFHLNHEWLPGGFIGVDIFFVISGYLITSIVNYKLENKKFKFIEFYKSRIKRIVPVYLILLIFVLITSIFVYVYSDIRALRKNLFWSFLFNSNNYFAGLDTYFGAANNENPLLHTWTLAVEMQFYLFLPILLFFVKRKWLPYVLTILTIGLFVYSEIEISYFMNKSEMYFSTLARTPEFFVGSLFSILSSKGIRIRKNLAPAVYCFATLIIILSSFLITEESHFPGFMSLFPCVATGALLICDKNIFMKVLSTRSFVFIGELSYSIYLWHWPIMAFLRYYNAVYEFSLLETVSIIVATIFFSALSYYIIEVNFRKSNDKKFLIFLAPMVVFFTTSLFYMIPVNKKLSYIPVQYSEPSFGMRSHGRDFKTVETFGDTTSATYNKNILLIGDSHALALKPYLNYIGKNNNFSFRTITNNAYPLIPGIEVDDFSDIRYYEQYKSLLKYAESEIDNADIIFFSCSWNSTISSEKKAFKKLITKLKKNQYVILIKDFPYLNKNPLRVNRSQIKDINRNNEYVVKYKQLPKEILEIVNNYPNVFYLNFKKLDSFENAPFYNDTLMYYDASHLNTFGAEIYARETEKQLMILLNTINR